MKNKQLKRVLYNRMIDRKYPSKVKFTVFTTEGAIRIKPPIDFK